MVEEEDMKLICSYVLYKISDDLSQAKIVLKSNPSQDVKEDVWMELNMIREIADSASNACRGQVNTIQQSAVNGLYKEIEMTMRSLQRSLD